jgi:5'-methylthioadenosine phosphorylase
MTMLKVGIIGGGALPVQWGLPYDRLEVDTPHGRPSHWVARVELGETEVFTLLRHGERHAKGSAINHHANVAAMQQLGCDVVVSLSLAGALSDRFEVGDTVVYDDVIDFRRSAASFYPPGSGRHVAMAPMIEPALAEQLRSITSDRAIPWGGAMVVIEGPRYSTFAESRMFAMLGGHLICQTIAPECFFVREAGMAWVGCCLVTDHDVHVASSLVSTRLIFENMKRFEPSYAANVLALVSRLRPFARAAGCDDAAVPTARLTGFGGT